MAAFRVAALLLPAAAAFLAPALWAWRPGWRAASAGHGALLGLLLSWGLVAGASASTLVATLAISTAFAVFALGLHLAAGQIASGLVVVALGSTLFLSPPIVDDAVNTGGRDVAQERMDLLLSVNPWAVLAAGPFQIDLLRDLATMYRSSHVADYVYARPPAWGGVAAGYAVGGALLAGAAAAGRRIRRWNPPVP